MRILGGRDRYWCSSSAGRSGEALREKYGTTGEREMRWALGTPVSRDRRSRIISLSRKYHIYI
jgi:hypothetical protein